MVEVDEIVPAAKAYSIIGDSLARSSSSVDGNFVRIERGGGRRICQGICEAAIRPFYLASRRGSSAALIFRRRGLMLTDSKAAGDGR